MLVKSAAAAERVKASLTRFVEGRLNLVVNRVKSKAAPLRQCAFLGFQIGARGRLVWTAQVHARFKHLLAMGIPPAEVHLATRSRKGYWRMSANSIVQRALTNRWLHQHGVPDMRTSWIALHYGPQARV